MIKTKRIGQVRGWSNTTTAHHPSARPARPPARPLTRPLTHPPQAGTAPGAIEKVFINICQHEGVEKPVMVKRLNEEGEEVEGLNVPLSIGPPRACDDAKGVKVRERERVC